MTNTSQDIHERTPLLEEANLSSQATKKTSLKTLKPFIASIISSNYLALIAGLNDGNFGIIIPRLREYYDISNGVVSVLFLCNCLGFFFSATCNGYLVHKLGQLKTIYLGATIITIAYLILYQGWAFPIMCFGMVIQGSALGLMNASINVYIANLPSSTLLLNILHAFYGIGALISPLVGTWLLANNLSWKGIYVFLLCIAIFNFILITIGFKDVDFDKDHQKEEINDQEDSNKDDEEEDDATIRRKAIRNRMTLLGALYILSYAGVEVCVGGWSYTYLKDGLHGDPIVMGKVVSGYWTGLAVGRLVLGWFTGRFGEKPMISLFTTIAAILLIFTWIIPVLWVDCVCIVLVGFFIGPMFPSCVALASKVLPKKMHPTAIGFMSAFGAAGGSLFPFLLGQIAEFIGILYLPLAWFTSAVVMQVIWTFIPNGKTKLKL
ncbi:unnamed protein product [Cunninghamella blakesleeana]